MALKCITKHANSALVRSTSRKTTASLFHPNVFAEKGWNIEVLAFNDCRLAFLETSARDLFELQDFLLRLNELFLRWLSLFFHDRFFLRRNQTRRGLFDRWDRNGRRRF